MAADTRRKSVYNALFAVLQQGVTLILGLIVPQLFIRAYGSQVNGLQASVNSIYTYIALLEAGIGTAALQSLYAPVARGDRGAISSVFAATHRQYRRIARLYLGCMAVFAAVYPATVDAPLPYATVSGIVLFSGVSSLLSFLSYGKLMILLQADGRNYVVSGLSTLLYAGISLCRILLIRAGAPVLWLYAAGALVAVCVTGVYAMVRRRVYPWLDERAVPDTAAISQSKHVLVHQISSIICNSTDVMVLTYVCRDLALVSVYNVYNMIYEVLRTLLMNLFGSVDFILGQSWGNDRERFRRIYPVYESVYITAAFVLYTSAYALTRPFMELYTARFTDADYLIAELPLLFTLAKLMYNARNPAIQLITWAGHFRQTQTRSVIETCINIAVSIPCAARWGIDGVLFGTIAAMTYRTIDIVLYISRHLLSESPWRHFRPMLVCWSGFAAAALLLRRIPLPADGYLRFFVLAVPVTAGIVLFYGLWNLLFNRRVTLEALRAVKTLRKPGA